MFLEIISPEKVLFNGQIKSILVPATDGYLQLLNNHAPIVTTIAKGVVEVKQEDGTLLKFELESGLLEAHQNKVSLLAEV